MYLPDPDQAILLSHYSPGIEAKHNILQNVFARGFILELSDVMFTDVN